MRKAFGQKIRNINYLLGLYNESNRLLTRYTKKESMKVFTFFIVTLCTAEKMFVINEIQSTRCERTLCMMDALLT